MRSVWFTGSFEGFHHWADAPEAVSFLRDRHRHLFHWRAEAPVVHGDRAIEFIMAKRSVEAYVAGRWPDGELGSMSCEMVAEDIGAYLRIAYSLAWCLVSVSEDEENGGRVLVGALTVTEAEGVVDLSDPTLLINILGGAGES